MLVAEYIGYIILVTEYFGTIFQNWARHYATYWMIGRNRDFYNEFIKFNILDVTEIVIVYVLVLVYSEWI